mgnify:FL=1
MFQTITAAPTANIRNSGITSRDKSIAIGVGVGVGIPVIAAIIIVSLLLYRRKQQNSVQNYVDSNGKDAGIAVDDGNFFKRTFRHAFIGLPILKNNPNNVYGGDFDDDNDLSVIANEPKGNLSSNTDINTFTKSTNNTSSNINSNLTSNSNSVQRSNTESNTGFFVNRPKPLRLVNHSSEDDISDSDIDNENNNNDHPIKSSSNSNDTDDPDTDEYLPAPESQSNSNSPSHLGEIPRLWYQNSANNI